MIFFSNVEYSKPVPDRFRNSKQEGIFILEAASGFGPLHKGFADLSLSHLGTPPMERETGLEPATPTLARLCSTN